MKRLQEEIARDEIAAESERDEVPLQKAQAVYSNMSSTILATRFYRSADSKTWMAHQQNQFICNQTRQKILSFNRSQDDRNRPSFKTHAFKNRLGSTKFTRSLKVNVSESICEETVLDFNEEDDLLLREVWII
jgi:hypothetical protein